MWLLENIYTTFIETFRYFKFASIFSEFFLEDLYNGLQAQILPQNNEPILFQYIAQNEGYTMFNFSQQQLTPLRYTPLGWIAEQAEIIERITIEAQVIIVNEQIRLEERTIAAYNASPNKYIAAFLEKTIPAIDPKINDEGFREREIAFRNKSYKRFFDISPNRRLGYFNTLSESNFLHKNSQTLEVATIIQNQIWIDLFRQLSPEAQVNFLKKNPRIPVNWVLLNLNPTEQTAILKQIPQNKWLSFVNELTIKHQDCKPVYSQRKLMDLPQFHPPFIYIEKNSCSN